MRTGLLGDKNRYNIMPQAFKVHITAMMSFHIQR
jgi:hypothetical protein